MLILRPFLTALLFLANQAHAKEIRIAVASNFTHTLTHLAKEFKQQTGHELLISSASTGKLYAQIMQSAPFDIFMSADTNTAEKLITNNKAASQSLYTYAQGQLVFLSNLGKVKNCKEALKSPKLKYLALANIKTAPYGFAAYQVLQRLNLWDNLNSKIVTGENISQTMQFVSTKNAQAGFVAHAQIKKITTNENQCIWHIPSEYYDEINQALVVLKTTSKNHTVNEFIEFIKSDKAKAIISTTGYAIIEAP